MRYDYLFTDLENEVLKTLSNANGNGNYIDTDYSDYIEIFNFTISDKVLRGVLSSLVKKNIIVIEYDDVDDIGLMSTVKFTEEGYKISEYYRR